MARIGKAWSLSQKLWIFGTTSLISFLVFSPQIFIIIPYFRQLHLYTKRSARLTNAFPSSDSITNLGSESYLFPILATLLPFNFGAFLIFYNYYLCIVTDPGSVPKGWRPNFEAASQDDPNFGAGSTAMSTSTSVNNKSPTTFNKRIQPESSTTYSVQRQTQPEPTFEIKRYTHSPRFCKACKSFKPPRSHHCKTCKKCVLRMDHHCPWVANCVGHHNYSHFLRFLSAVNVTCCWHLGMLSLRIADCWNVNSVWRAPSTFEMVLLVINYALCVPVLTLVGCFSLYHFYCLSTNTTTIESWEKDKVATLVRRGKIREVKFPYNLGLVANIQSVLGKSPLLWCFPQPTPGDGLSYSVSFDEGAALVIAVMKRMTTTKKEKEIKTVWTGTSTWKTSREWSSSLILLAKDEPSPAVFEDEKNERGSHTKKKRLFSIFHDPMSQFAWPPKDPSRPKRYKNYKFSLPEKAFTYGNERDGSESFNPNLKPSNSSLRRRTTQDDDNDVHHNVSPYHPDFNREQDLDLEESDGVDVGCVPPLGSQTENEARREFFPSLWKDEDETQGNDGSFISGGSDSEEIEDEDDDDDDDLPLARNGQIRVRRGSEGYEVKPRSFNLEYQVEQEDLMERKRRAEKDRENYLKDQERLKKLGFGFGEHLDEEEIRSRDMIQEEQSWRRTELERERRELLQSGIVGENSGVLLPSEMMKRRQSGNLEPTPNPGLRPARLESLRRASAAESVNTTGDWGDE